MTVKQVAEELGVRFVLEGSVQRSGDTMRVTAQLIDAIDGRHIWAANFDRDITDLFAVKDEIILSIASNVSGEIDSGTMDRLAREGTESLEAWTLWKQGAAELGKARPPSNAAARRLAQRAIEIDPEFAAAYALLAGTYNLAAQLRVEPKGEALDTALSHANEALRLDETSALAYSALAGIYRAKGELDLAVEAAEKAATLGPNEYSVHGTLGVILNSVGRFQDAASRVSLAMRLSPNYPAWIPGTLADAHLALGEFNRAEEALKLKLARKNNPRAIFDAHMKLALVYPQTDREREALQAIAQARAANPRPTILIARIVNDGVLDNNPEIVDGWTRIWRRLGIPEVLGMQAFRPEDRLSGERLQEIRASPWWYGADPRQGTEHWAFNGPEGEVEMKGAWTGRLRQLRAARIVIEDDLNCNDITGVGRACSVIYRNPDGTRKNSNEFILLSGAGAFPFSTYETRPPALEGK